jgi:hypothetical protein
VYIIFALCSKISRLYSRLCQVKSREAIILSITRV